MGSLSGYLLPVMHRSKEKIYTITPYLNGQSGLMLTIKY